MSVRESAVRTRGVDAAGAGAGADASAVRANSAPLAAARWAGQATNCAHANSAPAHKLKQ